MHKSANINVNVNVNANVSVNTRTKITTNTNRTCYESTNLNANTKCQVKIVDFKMKIAVYSAKIEIFARSHEANIFLNEIIQLLHSENLL